MFANVSPGPIRRASGHTRQKSSLGCVVRRGWRFGSVRLGGSILENTVMLGMFTNLTLPALRSGKAWWDLGTRHRVPRDTVIVLPSVSWSLGWSFCGLSQNFLLKFSFWNFVHSLGCVFLLSLYTQGELGKGFRCFPQQRRQTTWLRWATLLYSARPKNAFAHQCRAKPDVYKLNAGTLCLIQKAMPSKYPSIHVNFKSDQQINTWNIYMWFPLDF